MYSDDTSPHARLSHILESAEYLRSNLNDLTFSQFVENRTLVLATLHTLLIVGEASIALPDEIKDSRPELPWRRMRAMRNIIAHRYYKVDLGLVWRAIHNHFLPIEQDFRTLLDSLPQDQR